MKYYILVTLFCVSLYSQAQSFKFEQSTEVASNPEETTFVEKDKGTNLISWLSNLEEAKQIAKKEQKLILMYFTGSDWCPPCIALKEDFFGSDKFQEEYSKKYVFLLIDYPRRKDIISESQMKYNRSLIDTYNTSKTFPKILVLNEFGKEKGKISGYSSYNTYKDTSHHFKFVAKYASK